MKRFEIILISMFLLTFSVGFFVASSDIYFEINKNIELFGKVYRDVTLNYVDEISPEKFMLSGIKGMLQTLDPYSVFIDESKKGEVDLLTTGKYGGVGILIGLKGDEISITEVMAGYSAQRQGLKVGDVIIEINRNKINRDNYDDISSLVRGEPGTEVHFKIRRSEESTEIEFHLIREEIQVKNLSFADFIPGEDGILYLKLDRFSRRAGEEIEEALNSLNHKEKTKMVVLDLRSNPGGLLQSAVDVLEKFIIPGEKLVEMRGRAPESNKSYSSVESPVFNNIPLAVLVDENSASASEIVAGCMQDLDRGIITGSPTFGKGLVQSILPLPYKATLKLTTAKYFTPSGRCIQKSEHSAMSKSVIIKSADSTNTNYKTKNNRIVKGSGGVTPDSVIINPELSDIALDFYKRAIFFKFAAKYLNENQNINLAKIPKDTFIQDFKSYLLLNKINYKSKFEKELDDVIEIAGKDNNLAGIISELHAIKNKSNLSVNNLIDKNADEIYWILISELASHLNGENGRIKYLLKSDHQLMETVKILKNRKLYNKLLNIN
ncbi:MAG: S41 family peptidase [Ignavibacteria bacterium]|nr:S41 family peptidase [Ignavibacteria bacterium]